MMHVVAGKAICFAEAMTDDFKRYAQQVVDNAKVLADALMNAGLSLVSGGTDNHLMLVNVTKIGDASTNLGGKKAEAVLDACGITVNMNMIPFDDRKPMDPSGIRIGTPALTTRGMGPDEMTRIGGWIHQALAGADDTSLHQSIRSEIAEMCESFPVPADRALVGA